MDGPLNNEEERLEIRKVSDNSQSNVAPSSPSIYEEHPE
jgi:hypothetical protein